MNRVKKFHEDRPHLDRLKNVAEDKFREEAAKRGWIITKRGWPDFFCISKTGEIFVVEVKPHANKPLKASQEFILRSLANVGLRSYMWTPEGFVRVKPSKK